LKPFIDIIWWQKNILWSGAALVAAAGHTAPFFASHLAFFCENTEF